MFIFIDYCISVASFYAWPEQLLIRFEPIQVLNWDLGSNLTLIIQIRAALDCMVDFNEHVKMCQNSLPSGVGRSLGGKISGGRGRLWGIFFGFYKTRHILLADIANCTVLCAVVLTQCRRVTDRQTDGNAIASTIRLQLPEISTG